MESLSLETGPAHARQEWEAAAAAVLRKSGRLGADEPAADVWEELARHTLDGLVVSPLGTPALVAGTVTSGRPARVGAWHNCPLFAGPDATVAAQEIRTDLENGATAVWLRLGQYAVPADGLATALSGVLLDAAPVILDAEDQIGAAREFQHLAAGKTLPAGTTLGVDPIGAAVRTRGLDTGLDTLAGARYSTSETAGAGHSTNDDAASEIAEAGRIAEELGCGALVADGTVLHELGASDVQELGYVLEVATSYLRRLVEEGRSIEDAAALICFRLAAGDEQFLTIAKMRAVRRVWNRVLEISGAPAVHTQLHAVTSRPMLSKYDPWVNMLRTCVASFSAGVGGADIVTVLPFDEPLGLPTAFSRRIARNTSALLVEEAHIGVVNDPAGGSHVVEKLTDDTAVAAWAQFGELEANGFAGLSARIEAIVAERDDQVARRTRPLTGLSEFPNLHESLPERIPHPSGAPQVRRYGHAFEDLRDDPAAQPVFLATMGTVAAHTARASFATNLFAAGGIDVVNEGAHADADAVLAHYHGEAVVCLVGADPAYAEWGTELADRLREAGATWVIVAGKALEGADDDCAMGEDALDFLTRTRKRLR